jgi:myosin heavy subunit
VSSQHYAGSVRYDSTGFCEKNRDSLSRDLYGLMERSHDSLNQVTPTDTSNMEQVDAVSTK